MFNTEEQSFFDSKSKNILRNEMGLQIGSFVLPTLFCFKVLQKQWLPVKLSLFCFFTFWSWKKTQKYCQREKMLLSSDLFEIKRNNLRKYRETGDISALNAEISFFEP